MPVFHWQAGEEGGGGEGGGGGLREGGRGGGGGGEGEGGGGGEEGFPDWLSHKPKNNNTVFLTVELVFTKNTDKLHHVDYIVRKNVQLKLKNLL